MFKEVKYSLSTLIGTRYMENVAKANAFFGKMSYDEAMAIVDKFLSTDFEGGRHIRRVEKIACK